jgi:hypothetical protein
LLDRVSGRLIEDADVAIGHPQRGYSFLCPGHDNRLGSFHSSPG